MFRVPPVRQSASAGPSKTPPYWTDAPRTNSGPLREEEYLGFLAFAALTSGGYTRRSAVVIQTRWPTPSGGLLGAAPGENSKRFFGGASLRGGGLGGAGLQKIC